LSQQIRGRRATTRQSTRIVRFVAHSLEFLFLEHAQEFDLDV